MKRKIICIDEEKCNGCGLCIPDCPEGALKIIDGKVRLISDLFCDGLGACIGSCPEDAITIEEREAEPYDEKKVMEKIVKAGTNTIKEHLKHLKSHNEMGYLHQAMDYLRSNKIDFPFDEFIAEMHGGGKDPHSGCPGSKIMDFTKKQDSTETEASLTASSSEIPSQLRQWPIQITLVSPSAPYLKDADLLIAADCVPFTYANFHNILKGKVLLIGCPKLDDAEFYKEKITEILKNNNIKSITCMYLEVPCCFGLVNIIREAIKLSQKEVPLKNIKVSIKGEIA